MRTIAAFAGLILLSGCQTTESVDSAIQESLPKVCQAAAAAHAGFAIVADRGEISKSLAARESAAFTAVEIICADPKNTNSAVALVKLTQAFSVVSSALRTAERVEENGNVAATH